RILENLLEAEEFDRAEQHGRMKAQTAFEWAEGRVELNAKASIDLHLPLVVNPRHTEDDLPFRLANAFDQRRFGIVGMFGDNRTKAIENLAHGLVKFILPGLRRRTSAKIGSSFSS